jgi:hypothetical protein
VNVAEAGLQPVHSFITLDFCHPTVVFEPDGKADSVAAVSVREQVKDEMPWVVIVPVRAVALQLQGGSLRRDFPWMT